MKVSSKGIALIVRFEGEVLKVYADPIGLPTLGVGHLLTKAELKKYPLGTPISKALSRQFLAQDLERFEAALERLVEVDLTQNQYDALLSLIFNIGIGAFTKSTLLKKLNRKDYQGAADAFLSWVRAGGSVLPGLVTRRKAERRLFLAPDTKPTLSAGNVPSVPEGGETQTNSSNPPSASSFGVGDALNSVLTGVDRAADAETRIGRSTWTRTLGSKIVAIFLAIVAAYIEHWEILLPATVIFVVAAYFLGREFMRSRKAKKANLKST
jgi:lysozyme